MHDDDNAVFRTFGGRNKAIAVIVALLVALAIFIVGAVMLGVGIHKANNAVKCPSGGDNNPSSTVGTAPTASPTNGPTNGPTSAPAPTPKPFYLTVINRDITGKDLSDNFGNAMTDFKTALAGRLTQDNPSITILSADAIPATSVGNNQEFAAGDKVAIGLVAVIYADTKLDSKGVQNQIDNDVFHVQHIEGPNDDTPSSPADQLCSQVNTNNSYTTTVQPPNPTTPQQNPPQTTVNQPNTPQPPAGSTQPPPVVTSTHRPSDNDYSPCVQRIVIAIDNAKSNGYSAAQKNFLTEHVFGGDDTYWNHTERLGLVWYASKVDNYIPFGTFAVNALSDVRVSINSVNPTSKATTPSIGVALDKIIKTYKTNGNYQNMSTIIFTSQTINQQIVDTTQDLANQLNTGEYRLTIIGLGGQVDPEGRYLNKLTQNNYIWTDPTAASTFPNWNDFFWNIAYGCNGSAPSEPATPGPIGTVTRPPTTTTLKPPPTPCAGHLLLMLDTSSAMSDSAFTNQITFVGEQLFSRSTTFFGDYSRLALGQCSMASKVERSFDGGLTVPADVTQYVDSLQKFGTNAQLDVCLEAITNEQINDGYTDTVTVAIHVSYLDSARKQSAIDNANTLKAQNIRLILIAHGGSVSDADLKDIAGSGGLNIRWPTSDPTPPKPAEWLKSLLGCSGDSDPNNSFFSNVFQQPEQTALVANNEEVNGEFDGTDYPCPGQIIIGYDTSSDLTAANYQKQANFLLNQVLNNRWTNVPRLAYGSYASYSNIQEFGFFQDISEIPDWMQSYSQLPVTPSLRRVLTQIAHDPLVTNEKPAHVILFVGTISDSIVEECTEFAQKIKDTKSTITFVALGLGVDGNLLAKLADNVIPWDINNKDTPDDWENQFWTLGYGCSNQPVTSKPVTGQTSPPIKRTTTASPPIPYIPCNDDERNEVIFFFDNKYSTVINFLEYKVFNYWTHLERLVLGYYSRFPASFEPGFFLTAGDIIEFLDNVQQSKFGPSIRRLFTSLSDNPITEIEDFSQYYVIFVSSITQDDANEIKPIIDHLGTKVTFVALKDADQTILRNLVPDVIDWKDLTLSEPPGWEDKFWAAYGCSGKKPTVPPPVTIPSRKTNPPQPGTTRLVPTGPPVKHTTTPVPFLPCERQVVVAYDLSNSLSASLFTTLKGFLENQLFADFTHFERLGFGYYGSYFSVNAPGFFQNADDIKQFVEEFAQELKGPTIRRVIQYLAQNQFDTSMPQTIVLLVGSLTDDDVDLAKDDVATLKQFSKLSIIGLQSSVSKTTLDKLADYSYILDLAKPLPSNLPQIISQAFGC
ncbi:hypothetical protein M3Y97_00190600 [Aphelenchoides bicaudatus]|nr:hypothetical protein M3Y97_00190600 [Aphelenchoides bicaudatus]